MKRFRHGHAAAADWRTAVAACLSQIDAGGGAGGGNLGFLYVTDYFAGALPEISRHVADATGVGHWVGTVGIGICATGVEYLDEPAITLMIGDFPADSFRVFPAVSGTERLQSLDLRCGTAPASVALVHADPLDGDIARQIRLLAKRTESGFLVGGLASSRNGNMLLADVVERSGMSGVAFSDAVTVATRLTQGCSPVGAAHEITGAQNNIVVELDGRPALDVLRADVGVGAGEDLAQLGGQIFAGLGVSGSDTGDYVVRNLIGIDPGNRLIAIGDVARKGQRLRFCRRDHDTARADMARMLDSIREGLYTAPRGALYYSCLGRGGALFGGKSAELGMIRDALGDVPLAGFFCNGEISHNRLYGYTGVLTLFL
ncbi:MAG: FIST C-terminal domain-containing protein [Burkholderiales bacterium]|nr:FIST C-terminal domain-containing protein [Burkholderiales bacterium]